MSHEVISVIGDLGEFKPEKLDAELSQNIGTMIVAGQHALYPYADYACTNNAEQLDFLVKNKAEKTVVLAPRDQYAKYVFYNKIECVPIFEDLKPYNFDPLDCSQQVLALATACWIGSPVIALFDYLLESKKENPALKAIMKIYSSTQFFLIRGKKSNKVGIFEDMPNVKQIDQKEFVDFYKQYVGKL
jgi:hypothetical protein